MFDKPRNCNGNSQVKPWGCKWFQLWREAIETAVKNDQTLQVYFFAGRVGQGKVSSWSALRDNATRRDALSSRKEKFLQTLPAAEKARLETLRDEEETSSAFSTTERSERWDEEVRECLTWQTE